MTRKEIKEESDAEEIYQEGIAAAAMVEHQRVSDAAHDAAIEASRAKDAEEARRTFWDKFKAAIKHWWDEP